MRGLTGADFDAISFHDDSLYGLSLRLGDPAAGDWTSELVLDVDHIVEWVRSGDRFRFRVAPATLVFHGVTDLAVAIEPATGGLQVAPVPPTVDRLERTRVADQRVYLDRPYYAWRIVFHGPGGGGISFGAFDFTLTLRGEPLLLDEQAIPGARRPPLQS